MKEASEVIRMRVEDSADLRFDPAFGDKLKLAVVVGLHVSIVVCLVVRFGVLAVLVFAQFGNVIFVAVIVHWPRTTK